MKIILVGAGNLATQLGHALHQAGHDLPQVYSHTMTSAQLLADQIGAEPTDDIDALATDADLYIIAVKDRALSEVISRLCPSRRSQVFVHTAGSMPMDVFKGQADHYGVFYPMQTFSKNRAVDFHVIPTFLEWNDAEAENLIQSMATSVTNRIYHLPTADRKYLHLAAVWACNFTNHCYEVSANLLARHGIPFDVMLPLIDETAHKVHTLTPHEAQTGPAVRYDENVIRAQSALLSDIPRLRELYELLSKDIHEVNS
ncbi:MAG: Rossmann-like and DUF2520 domain-containing protein [Prevotella sp.]|jgi:predicted short-subunit dehydrogenase-like oxidoreductase (DUF2520 family)